MKDQKALEIRSLLLVYGSLLLVTLIGEFFFYNRFFICWHTSGELRPFYVILAIFFVAAYVGFAHIAVKFSHWGQNIHKIFAQVLTPLSYFQILILSLLSGFMEEWFFRGLLVPQLGIILSSIFFALAHFIPARSVWVYAFISFAASIILGMLYKNSGSLLLVAVTHSIINFLLIVRLNQVSVGAPSLSSLK